MTQYSALQIAKNLQLSVKKVSSALQLLAEGATIPFIARYRKEMTGGLNEVEVQAIESEGKKIKDLEDRRKFILHTISEQGKLSHPLKGQILNATTTVALEDLYLPYKKKRKTRAETARGLGLAPLAEAIWRQPESSFRELLGRHQVNDLTAEAALDGAKDILAERISELIWVRDKLRSDYALHAILHCKLIKSKEQEAGKYRDYFDYQEKLARCPSHRYLAINRGEKEGFLRVSLKIEEERSLAPIKRKIIKSNRPTSALLNQIVDDAFSRLLAPSLENETRKHYKEVADKTAIQIFGKNLRQLLLAPPLGQKNILGIDPGFRTGCKVVALDKTGDLLHHATIFPHPPQKKSKEAGNLINEFIHKYNIEAVAIGNGTAGRETLDFFNQLNFPEHLNLYLVNENGASIYSASEVAREEFPDKDITVRGAVSIGRRLMDPLAELVKIDPKSIGVGQYQHDVNQKQLQTQLDHTIASCVNAVGINLNTASPYLLAHVSGLGKVLAQRIVQRRSVNGPFRERKELRKIEGLGAKAYEQSAGFLRIKDGLNRLDDTGVHPEAYSVVEKMVQRLNCTLTNLLEDQSVRQEIDLVEFVTPKIGIPTLTDIMEELAKPGLDPRGKAQTSAFSDQIRTIEDLRPGMTLPAQVTNITHFGAFVDIGIKENGLIHKSQMGKRYVIDPSEILQLDQKINVKVLEVDLDRKRIQLMLDEQ